MIVSRAMPSALHEGLIELFRLRETLASELLTDVLGLELPAFERTEFGDSVRNAGIERRADAVILLRQGKEVVYGIVIEVQLKKDVDKHFRQPFYAVSVRDRDRCDVVVLVITIDSETAEWAAKPIRLGPGFVWQPLVLGPKLVPYVTAEEARKAPELGVLSAMVHGHEENGLDIALSALAGVVEVEGDERRQMFYDLVMAGLTEAVQKEFEAMALSENYEFQSTVVKNLIARGEAVGRKEGRREGGFNLLIRALEHRGFAIDDGLRAQIHHASDDTLDRWMFRLMDGADLETIFGDS